MSLGDFESTAPPIGDDRCSWWSGPDIYLPVDDCDLVAGSGNNPLSNIVDPLPQPRDIGQHLTLIRRARGASLGTTPLMGGGSGDATDHSTWLQEDENVWSTDSDAAPPVLGS